MITSVEALDNALDALERLDPSLGPLRHAVGRPPLRKRAPGFAGLAGIVVGQQVSTASAAAILRRLEDRFTPLTAAAVAEAREADLAACGLSRPKIRTLHAAARQILSGACPLDRLGALPAEEAHARLCAIPGIGPWSADIYLLFCLGHPDVFPAGDLALQEALRLEYGFPARPGAREAAAFAARWQPFRGAAATLLWAVYALRKGRITGIPPA